MAVFPSSYYDEFIDPLVPVPNAFAIRAEHSERYRFAKRFLRGKGIAVLYDVACGDGYGTKLLSSVCQKVYGFDLSHHLLHIANKNYAGKHIMYVQKNLEEDLLWQRPFPDAIVSFETLEHVANPMALLLSFAAILPRGGYLLLSTPNAKMEPKKQGKSKNPYHKHLFTKEALLTMVTYAGFRVQSVNGQPYTNTLMHTNRWLMRLLNKITYRSYFMFNIFSFLGKVTPHRIDKSYSIILVARKK